MTWISAIKTDIDAARTKQADIPVCKSFRHEVFGRKVAHSERMKPVWRQRRINLSKRF